MHAGKTTESTKSFVRLPSIRPIQNALIEWGNENYDEFPWRSTSNSFHALLAEIMLQRTRAEQVAPVYNNFTSSYGTPSEAASSSSENLIEILKPLGLHWRIKNTIKLIRVLSEIRGKIPAEYDELVKLPGVGSYVASSFLSFHVGVKASIVDSNVVRIYGRIFNFNTDAETRRKKWFLELAEQMTPDIKHKEYNYALLDLARKICKKTPLCSECPLNPFCDYASNSATEENS